MSDTIHIRGTRADIRRILHGFLAGLGGRSGEFAPYVRGIKLRIGMVALSCIQQAFIDKASGGTGDDGIAWAPLKKETVANRRVGPRDLPGLKALGITKKQYGYGRRAQSADDLDKLGRLKRGFLTTAQDKRWRMIFGTRKANLVAKHGLSDQAASARAAEIAWSILKSEGALTKLEVLGNRHVDIGRDTGRLFNSLSPGTPDPDHHAILEVPPDAPNPEDRILREEPGAVIVGSNVAYADPFHAKRPLWPVELPEPWAERIVAAAQAGVAEALAVIMQGQGRAA